MNERLPNFASGRHVLEHYLGPLSLQENSEMPQNSEKTGTQEKLELRQCVARFARIMEEQLRANDHKRMWPRPTHIECCGYIDKHLLTVIKRSALADPMAKTERDDADEADKAAANVANFMLLLLGWDVNRENLNRRE